MHVISKLACLQSVNECLCIHPVCSDGKVVLPQAPVCYPGWVHECSVGRRGGVHVHPCQGGGHHPLHRVPQEVAMETPRGTYALYRIVLLHISCIESSLDYIALHIICCKDMKSNVSFAYRNFHGFHRCRLICVCLNLWSAKFVCSALIQAIIIRVMLNFLTVWD